MGLDLALGSLIAMAAIRGWFKGFTSQAVRLFGLAGCFYLAGPVREQARPFVFSKLPSLDPGLLDRILWWTCAVVSYLVLVGFSTLAIQLMKTPPEPGMPRSHRQDRFAGLFLGAAKGLLVVSFLAAGILKYGGELNRFLPWSERQTQGSYALLWSERYQPVPRIWASPPVRHFVEHIQHNGLPPSDETVSAKQVAERTSGEAESETAAPRLEVPPAETVVPDAALQPLGLDPALIQELERIKAEIDAKANRRP
jgi:hypothetical protein